MYFPVAVQWIALSLHYRSITLPFLANPSLRLSGMVGVPKTDLMNQAQGNAQASILPWISFTVSEADLNAQTSECMERAKHSSITLPFACKPNIGCRGVGVKLVETPEQLTQIISSYPKGAELLCQKLASYEPEVGIFYVKDPSTGKAQIPSMTLKTLPRVVGDGASTLGELIGQDPRARKLTFLYKARHKDQWERVLAKGETVRLVFSASHSKGAIFKDAREEVTPALLEKVDSIMSGIPNFYYGRLDVKFKDLKSLKEGKTLEIVEINGASAESIHIWDKDTSFREAIRSLLWQYRTLFQIGAYHREQGKQTPGLHAFLRSWRTERFLTRHYPLTD